MSNPFGFSAEDIDLTIVGTFPWQTFMRLESELDDLLLPYQIDLSLYEHIDSEELIAHIERVGQVFYQQAPSADKSAPTQAPHL